MEISTTFFFFLILEIEKKKCIEGKELGKLFKTFNSVVKEVFNFIISSQFTFLDEFIFVLVSLQILFAKNFNN